MKQENLFIDNGKIKRKFKKEVNKYNVFCKSRGYKRELDSMLWFFNKVKKAVKREGVYYIRHKGKEYKANDILEVFTEGE